MGVLGLDEGAVRLAPYNKEWLRLYAAESARIRSAVGEWLLDLQHVGSTSIPGMQAKPIIDIGGAVQSFEGARACIAPLEAIGYIYRGENGVPRRHYFIKGDPVSYHLHIVEINSAEWQALVLFRDYLIANPSWAEAYVALKQELAARYAGDRPAYTEAKGEFIQQILRRASEGT